MVKPVNTRRSAPPLRLNPPPFVPYMGQGWSWSVHDLSLGSIGIDEGMMTRAWDSIDGAGYSIDGRVDSH